MGFGLDQEGISVILKMFLLEYNKMQVTLLLFLLRLQCGKKKKKRRGFS